MWKHVGLKEARHQNLSDHVATAAIKQLTGLVCLCSSGAVTDLSAVSFL